MYSTEVNGEVLEFGTSGWLFRSNKLMYDRSTNTLWQQFRGEPVVGPLADSGIILEVLPVALTTWADWVEAHPDTTVLDVETGVYPARAYLPESDEDSGYFGYRQRDEALFPVPERSELLPTKAQVLGLTFNGRARAYPQAVLGQNPVLNDSLGGGDVVVVTPDEGGGSRAYQRDGHRFIAVEKDGADGEAVFLVDEEGRKWRMDEEALVSTGDPSTRLPWLPSRTSYWFGWYSFYPATEVYASDQ